MREEKPVHDEVGYSLTTAMLIVRQMETQATRNAVFSEIKSKNFIFSLADRLYDFSRVLKLHPVLLVLYMLKCVSSVGPKIDPSSKVVSISNFGNEAHSIDRILTLVPQVTATHQKLARKHIIEKGQLNAMLQLVKAVPRCWRLIRYLGQTHDFMPACRIASVLAFYVRFDRMFSENSGLRDALIASNYSPEAVALAAAAHRNGRRVIYANHAPVPANSPYVPPVLADCSVFYGNAIRETYRERSRCHGEVILIGQPGETTPMSWCSEVKTVGIFLTALTQYNPLEKLVVSINNEDPHTRILIRHHPVSLLETDVSALMDRYPDIRATRGTPLDQDIRDCDLVFCGNSGVTMNVLRGGRPVAYLAELDGLPYDYIGLVAGGLVMEAEGWQDTLYERLRRFYESDAWQTRIRQFDASYGQDNGKTLAHAQNRLTEWLQPTSQF